MKTTKNKKIGGTPSDAGNQQQSTPNNTNDTIDTKITHMKNNSALPKHVRFEGDSVVMTEDNVGLTLADIANILIEMHCRGVQGIDIDEMHRIAGGNPPTPQEK